MNPSKGEHNAATGDPGMVVAMTRLGDVLERNAPAAKKQDPKVCSCVSIFPYIVIFVACSSPTTSAGNT